MKTPADFRKKRQRPKTLRRWLRGTSNRTFVFYPVCILAFEYLEHGGRINFEPWGLPLLLWGYLEYRLCGIFRTRIGGGGPGIEKPPDRIADSGIYAYTRNPMYLGHLIFMLGLTITLASWAALLLLAFHIVWFQRRVLKDEEHLTDLFGEPYTSYQRRVKRWIPFII